MRNRSVLRTLGIVVLLVCPQVAAQDRKAPATRFVEIRSYNLKAGTRDRFHERFVRESLPMLRRRHVDVVAYGPSLHDKDSWFLMRGFASIEAREKSEDAFYGSDEWKKGPREATLADIDSYTTVLVRLDDAAIAGLRALPTRG